MNRKQFLLVISIPAIVILAFVGVKYFTLAFGEKILLKTVPVDPRDLFRGDYVALDYEVSRINLNEIPYDYKFSNGETVYATLSKGDKFWDVNSVSHKKPSLNEGEVCMKGKVISSYGDFVRIEWGIESYFVPEGKGQPIERQRNAGNVSVEVSVDSTCSAIIKELYINDEPIQFE